MQTFYQLEYQQDKSKYALHTISEERVMDSFESIKNDCNEFTFKMHKSDYKGIDRGFKISYKNYTANVLA